MRWREKRPDWKRRFAWLPIYVQGEWCWLEGYWIKHCGDRNLVQFGPIPPKSEASANV